MKLSLAVDVLVVTRPRKHQISARGKNSLRILDNCLTSGHDFSENESLLKFRFSILNIFLILPAIATFLNYIASYSGVIDSGELFETAILVYFIALLFNILILRKDKKYYVVGVLLFISSALILFYFVLFTRLEDEFRLISLFLAMFNVYVLLGKKAGVITALFIAASVLFISKNYELEISSYAYSTFFTFFIVFAGFLYYFLDKIEKDSLEYKLLHSRLEKKVKRETSQRMDQEQMLLHRSRMANMGELMDSIAHQWRQPLMHINSILLNIEGAVESNKSNNSNEYIKDKIDEVANLTTHMSQTIEDFRGLFKTEKEQTNFHLQNIISDVLVLLKNTLNDIEVEYNNADNVSVLGHRNELMQVIIIILSNSIDVLNARRIQNKKITIDIDSSINNACISIEDNAGGISSEHVQAIFDPYFTTKEQSGGTGLGLYIAKIIVEHNMKGDISVSNTAGGARFSISMIREPSIQALNSA